MAAEATVARESSARPLNGSGSRRGASRERMLSSIADSLNDSGRYDAYTEDLEYSRGRVTAYTTEKGYGSRTPSVSRYTSKPVRGDYGRGWSQRESYAESVFSEFSRRGLPIKELIHYRRYD